MKLLAEDTVSVTYKHKTVKYTWKNVQSSGSIEPADDFNKNPSWMSQESQVLIVSPLNEVIAELERQFAVK
jgi:hypothetical protein